MTAVGVTGHQRIPAEALDFVSNGIRECLAAQQRPLVGYSSLAVGADQMFARAVLDAEGDLVAIIPCQGYEQTFDIDGLVTYRALLNRCAGVAVLDFAEPTEEAFMEAGKRVMEASDAVVAIWDGQPAAGLGGTADAVAYANILGKEVIVIWPRGVVR